MAPESGRHKSSEQKNKPQAFRSNSLENTIATAKIISLADVSLAGISSSNLTSMKKTVHLFATLLCLLTLLVSAATCVKIAQPKQFSCDHCPKQSTPDQSLPSCCSAQQQQPAVVASQVEPQIQLHAVPVFALSNEIPSLVPAAVLRLTAPPPLPPRTPLRI